MPDHVNPTQQAIIQSLNQLDPLFKQRTPAPLTSAVYTDFATIALAAIRLLLDFSIYLFITAMLVMGVIFLFSMGNEETTTRAKRTLNQAMIGLVIVFASFAGLQFFTSALGGVLNGGGGANIAVIFGTAYNLVLLSAATGFVIIILYAGVRYLFAGGNEESQEGAKKMINAAMYGLILTLGSFAISRFLITSFGAIPR